LKLHFTASTIKSWFQYRCERKVVYESMDYALKAQVPILEKVVDSPWAQFGNEFEDLVIARLRREHPGDVLGPLRDQGALSPEMTRAFLGRHRSEIYAHQALLVSTEVLREHLGLDADITLKVGKPDILKVTIEDGVPVFRIIDVKATQQATVFHKAQVAFYALMLRAMLRQNGMDGQIDDEGEIWHLPANGVTGDGEHEKESFRLHGYIALVEDFFRNQVPRFKTRHVGPGVDDTFFHLYFKCEQCPYLAHCHQAIDRPAADRWDLSAVPGVTHESKRALQRLGFRTVGELARAQNLRTNPAVGSWALKARGQELAMRAQALTSSRITRFPDRFSHLMPPRTDVAIHLVVDQDPVDNHLSTLGCRITSAGSDAVLETVAVIERPEQEIDGLRSVLAQVLAALSAVDKDNREQQAGLIAHIFLFEPSEGHDLQAAIGRHLEDPTVLNGLLDLVRIFPPEEALPQPEYKGAQHLPASALRSVVSALYALPVKVSYDLAHVTGALLQADPAIEVAYQPDVPFARPFSSRLSIDMSRGLRLGTVEKGLVEADAQARLAALDALRRWIEADNSNADVAFLRLKKKPFEFQSAFHPLAATDLDVLLAQELLESRSGLLAKLVELALPAEQRRDRFRCFAGLELVNAGQSGRNVWMRFKVPQESQQAELSSGSMGLILHNDDPDIRLDPARWSSYRISIAPERAGYGRSHILVTMPKDRYDAAAFSDLHRKTTGPNWYIDETFVDVNTSKIADFLTFLAKGTP
jgi:hypothetical protein